MLFARDVGAMLAQTFASPRYEIASALQCRLLYIADYQIPQCVYERCRFIVEAGDDAGSVGSRSSSIAVGSYEPEVSVELADDDTDIPF